MPALTDVFREDAPNGLLVELLALIRSALLTSQEKVHDYGWQPEIESDTRCWIRRGEIEHSLAALGERLSGQGVRHTFTQGSWHPGELWFGRIRLAVKKRSGSDTSVPYSKQRWSGAKKTQGFLFSDSHQQVENGPEIFALLVYDCVGSRLTDAKIRFPKWKAGLTDEEASSKPIHFLEGEIDLLNEFADEAGSVTGEENRSFTPAEADAEEPTPTLKKRSLRRKEVE